MKIYFQYVQFLVVIFFIFINITGCGQSGSSPNNSENGNYEITITLENIATGQKASVNEPFSVKIGQEVLLIAKVTNENTAPAPGRLVTAAFSDATCKFLNTTDGSMATDANGEVSMRFKVISGVTQTGETLTVTSDLPVDSLSPIPSVFISFTIDPSTLAGTIEFVSATPNLIGLDGTTNFSQLPSQSTLEFVVKDNQTNPTYGQTVNFSLTTNVGGILVDPASAITDIEGKVSVVVKSGTVPTAIRVKAEVPGTSLYTLSSEVILSTGFPDQNSFSISAKILNPEAMDYDGEIVEITVKAGDINNNPVPDGTAIYFTTEGGVIQNSCQTQDGECSVNWSSQAPRPTDGRLTILAYTQGEESFQDLNGTGRYETGIDLLLTDMPEAYLDANENKIRDWDEIFVDFNNDQIYNLANGIYNGTLYGADPSGYTTNLVNVNADIILTMAESFSQITFSPASIDFNNIGEIANIAITVAGIQYGNAMPNGTTVTVTAPDNAEIKGINKFTVDNAIAPTTFNIILKPLDSATAKGTTDSLLVEVTTPKNNYSSGTLSVVNNLF